MGSLGGVDVLRHTNIQGRREHFSRSDEVTRLLDSVIPQLSAFVQKADFESECHQSGQDSHDFLLPTSLVHPASLEPRVLGEILQDTISIHDEGLGQFGLEQVLADVLKYSVNPSAPGFMDKLTAAPLPPGIVADLILSVLNTNLHVYRVSPVLTLVEKYVVQRLSRMFGFTGSRSGGISCQGGSASNLTSLVVARNTLYPETKVHGNTAVNGRLVIFTSSHAHYSVQKAAQVLGLGGDGVVSVPADKYGRIIPSSLEDSIMQAKQNGQVPFYINTIAGTTVLGSFDRFEEISKIATRHGLWLHVDGAWGGGFVFSDLQENKDKLRGVELADSIAINPHKMLGIPMTCSFLLGKDMRQFQASNTTEAGYLFHADVEESSHAEIGLHFPNPPALTSMKPLDKPAPTCDSRAVADCEQWEAPNDLADMTLQCGRRGDSLKLFLSWQYYGTKGYAAKVDHAYDMACYLTSLIESHPDLTPVLERGHQPGCLQVCFYYTPGGKFVYGLNRQAGLLEPEKQQSRAGLIDDYRTCTTKFIQRGKLNSQVTASVAKSLIGRGFMIDYAPALEGQEDRGHFFRAVVNISTISGTLDKLVEALVDVGNRTFQTAAYGQPSKDVSAIRALSAGLQA